MNSLYIMIKTKINISFIFLIVILVIVCSIRPTVFAFEATSSSFELHGGNVGSISGSGSSATFKNIGAGGQTSTGISAATKKIYSGILYWLVGIFTPVYEQVHYRWRADDGTEVTATFPVNEDGSYVNFPTNTVKRLRFEISNNSWTRTGSNQFTLEVASTTTCSSGTYAAVPTVAGQKWILATSTNLTDGSATTNVAGGLTDNAGTFVPGQIKTTGNTTSAITLTGGQFTEVEYAIKATSTATGQYCFRLTNNSSITNFLYTNYAQVALVNGLPATGGLDSAVFDTYSTTGALQGPAYNSIMWKGSQNGSLGKVQFQLATSDCPNGQTDYPTCSVGTWSFIGGSACDSVSYYDTTAADTPVEISCSPTNHNNKRYFRYRIRICTADCSIGGQASPIVDDVIVNWAP